MSRPRVVIAGLGDSGLLTAIALARSGVEVVGVSTKPGLVSGQELGLRLARPERWARDYRVDFDRFRRLDRVEVHHGELTRLDADAHTVTLHDGNRHRALGYDVLVIATGVSNGFWRRPGLESAVEVTAAITGPHRQLASAESLLVLGGGAAAVASALQCATRWPHLRVTLAFPGDRALPRHHRRVWSHVRHRLAAAGVDLMPGHRAVVPDGFECDQITNDPVTWSTGQPPTSADAVLWAIGRVTPNTGWLPAEVLDERGFVAVEDDLRVSQLSGVFAVGDVAATDPNRSSARNRADKLVAANVRAHLAGEPLRSFRPAPHRWGSVLGVEADGLRVFTPAGQPFRFPTWSVDSVLQPWIVRRGIYRGIRSSLSASPDREPRP